MATRIARQRTPVGKDGSGTKIKRLTETIATETTRREEAERSAREFGQLRSDLEAQVGLLLQQLETAQKQHQTQLQTTSAEQTRLQTHTEGLESAHAALEEQVNRFAESLARETKRRGVAEQETAEAVMRRSQLETELAENKQAQSQLRQDLEAAQKQQQAQRESSSAEQTRLETQIKDLQVARETAEQKARKLTEDLAEQTKRREAAEQQASETVYQRIQLEKQLGGLNQELDASQKQLRTQQEIASSAQLKLETRIKELQATQSELEQQVKRQTDPWPRKPPAAMVRNNKLMKLASAAASWKTSWPARNWPRRNYTRSWTLSKRICNSKRIAPSPIRSGSKSVSANCSRQRPRPSSKSSG
jgi:chromosome segregation ATPase